MPYKLIHKNILSIKADAIVNAANTRPVCCPGAEMDLYYAAGSKDMLDARISIGDIPFGEARYTEGFGLNAKYVIHTALPGSDVAGIELESIIKDCYRNSIKLAGDLGCNKVVMPVLMLDNYRLPKRRAIEIVMDSVKESVTGKDMLICIAISELEEFVLSDDLITRMDELLGCDESTALARDIDDIVAEDSESFGERFFRLVDEKGLTDAEVYHKANVNRKLISKLRTNPDKNVDKKTALALAVGLELDREQAEEFIKLAGYALSPRIMFDRIVSYFIENGIYDIQEINEALFRYTEKVLVGAER